MALFYHSLYITMKWLVLSTPLFLTAGLLLSLFLNQKYFGMNVFRTILYIPAVVSGVAVAVLWLQLLNPEHGVVNYLLMKLGVDNPPYWLEDPTVGHARRHPDGAVGGWRVRDHLSRWPAEHPAAPLRGGHHRRCRGLG